jgi:beta-aspartyl-peptidase (threonine type)
MHDRVLRLAVVLPLLGGLFGCAGGAPPASAAGRPDFAIVIHGGVGVIDKSAGRDEVDAHVASLRAALAAGRDRLRNGDAALDVVEAVVRQLEDDPQFNAGRGAVFTAAGQHELDASIMDGRDLSCGAVTGVRTVKNPIGLARLVKERTRHVLLAADGAEKFADEMRVERVPNEWFDTDRRRKAFDAWRKENAAFESAANKSGGYGTVGCVVLDRHGDLAAATSTGGMTGKRFGRIGDSPVIGAGCYANNATCAISCSGTGEQFIRHVVAKAISDRMELAGESLDTAARHVVFETLRPEDGGLIGVSRQGEIVMTYNTEGMFRGAADSSGRFEVGIWKEIQQ